MKNIVELPNENMLGNLQDLAICQDPWTRKCWKSGGCPSRKGPWSCDRMVGIPEAILNNDPVIKFYVASIALRPKILAEVDAEAAAVTVILLNSN